MRKETKEARKVRNESIARARKERIENYKKIEKLTGKEKLDYEYGRLSGDLVAAEWDLKKVPANQAIIHKIEAIKERMAEIKKELKDEE